MHNKINFSIEKYFLDIVISLSTMSVNRNTVNLIKSVDYFVTFTLRPTQYKHSIAVQLEKADYQILEFFEHMNTEGILVFELTKSANIHYHGILSFRCDDHRLKRLEFYIKDYFRKSSIIGFIDMSQVLDYNKTLTYLFKDYDDTKLFTECHPIRFNQKLEYVEDIQSYMTVPHLDLDVRTNIIEASRQKKKEGKLVI